jgi:hypothetical protein
MEENLKPEPDENLGHKFQLLKITGGLDYCN